MDCIDGKRKVNRNVNLSEGDHTWKRPSGFGNEVALYIHRDDKRPEIKKIQVAKTTGTGGAQLSNVAPVVESYTIEIDRNTKQDIQLKFIDTDGGPGPYTIEVITEPRHGTLSGVGNDQTFTPESGYRGEDQFSWKVNDGRVDSNISTITLIIK
jgi:hypothetical protein